MLKFSFLGISLVTLFLSTDVLFAKSLPSILLENHRYVIHSKQSGPIKLLISRGDRVLGNERLFEIGLDEIQIKLDLTGLKVRKAEAQLKKLQVEKDRINKKNIKKLEQARLKFAQKEALLVAGGLSEDAFKLAQINYDLAALQKEADDLTLSILELEESKLLLSQIEWDRNNRIHRAVVDGQISNLFVRSGEWVKQGQKVLELLSINPLYTKIMVPINSVNKFKKDQAFKIYVDQGGQVVKTVGTLDYISDEVDPLDQTVKLLIKINNDQRLFKPGTRLRVEIPK